jgi:hypothetical protein
VAFASTFLQGTEDKPVMTGHDEGLIGRSDRVRLIGRQSHRNALDTWRWRR